MRGFLAVNLQSYASKFKGISLPKNGMELAKEYHLTLVFFKDLSSEKVSIVIEKLKKFSFPTFELKADRILSLPNNANPELYGLGFEDTSTLEELFNQLLKIMEVEIEDKFNPHMTLIRNAKLAKGFEKSKEVYKKIHSFTIPIKSFVLYESNPDKGMNASTPLVTVNLKD